MKERRQSPIYVVVTPVRDEEDYVPLVIESVTQQTLRPLEWVLVNDGSVDRTGAIIDDAEKSFAWITAIHRENRGYRKWGAGIIEAFYDGFHALNCTEWEYLCKLDGDLSFEPDYFEKLLGKFRDDPSLGIAGGVLYHYENGKKVLERNPTFHVRGGVKMYRRACWDALGELWVGPGSDTVDEVKANMLGWTTRSFSEIQLRHHRFTGASWGRWGGMVKDGKTDYVCGYHPLFLTAKAIRRLVRRPYVLNSVALVYGYLSALLERLPRVDDAELIRYLREQQLARLSGRATIWR